MISDLAFSTWLRRLDAQRVVLVEAETIADGQPLTRYLSFGTYVSRPTDTPANQPYDDCVIEAPSYNTSIDGSFAIGEIAIWNKDHAKDAWALDAWAGWPCRLYLGDPAWSRADFRLLVDGVSAELKAPAADRLSIALRDRRELLKVPALTVRRDGRPNPLALGHVFNATPILVSANDLRYKANDGLVGSISVRDVGVAVSSVQDTGLGEFELVAPPAGDVTCDIQQTATTAAAMIRALCARAGYTLIDDANLDAFPNTATLGLYVDKQTNVDELISKVAATVGAQWMVDRLGRVQLKRLEEPVTPTPDPLGQGLGGGGFGGGGFGTGELAATLALTSEDIVFKSIALAGIEQPRDYVELAFAKNWTVQSAQSIAGVIVEDPAAFALFTSPYQVARAENNLLATFPRAERPGVVETLFVSEADAQDEADRRAALRAKVRRILSIETYGTALRFNVGDVAMMTQPYFGADQGIPVLVVAVNENPTRSRSTLQVWA